jgi:hypothetical protein
VPAEHTPFRGRLARRLAVAIVLLCASDVIVRGHRERIETAFLDHYRLAAIEVPPIDEFADAVHRRHAREPGVPVIGMSGPSYVWGFEVAPDQALPARLEEALARRGRTTRLLNLAMLHDSLADDRAVASYFAPDVNVLLAPYSARNIHLLGWCAQHPGIIEWSDRVPAPFAQPEGCPQPERHRVHARLDRWIAGVWSLYAHRGALKQLLFPASGDFGRWAHAKVVGAQHAAPPAATPRLPQLTEKDWRAIESETARLCEAYRGDVLFYRFPNRPGSDQAAYEEELVSRYEDIIRHLSERTPRCRLLPIDAHLDTADMIDHVHPNRGGIEKIAGALASALP